MTDARIRINGVPYIREDILADTVNEIVLNGATFVRKSSIPKPEPMGDEFKVLAVITSDMGSHQTTDIRVPTTPAVTESIKSGARIRIAVRKQY